MYRTLTCGEVDEKNVGEVVELAGWVNTMRDHGGIVFIDLRDKYGLVQLTTHDDSLLTSLTRESVITIKGKVVLRDEYNINPKMKSGKIEVEIDTLKVLSKARNILPFEVEDSMKVNEELRLKHRYLDLRNSTMQQTLKLRADMAFETRCCLRELGFTEVNTPILTVPSPEGARDYLVPSRVHKGKFYALPQAPQQFKQLLMTSGLDKYFQIAPCFRDEDARADRSPTEFYQIDMEMAFATQEDIFSVMEGLFKGIFEKFAGVKVVTPFKRIKYEDAMRDYCSDKPDLRNPLKVVDVTEIFKDTEFNAFKGATIKAIKANCGEKGRKFYDSLTDFLKSREAKGLAYVHVTQEGEFETGITKFMTEQNKVDLMNALNYEPNDTIFFVADDKARVAKFANILRNELGKKLGLIDENAFAFCWVVDFPFYELDDEGKIEFSHNPFSMPQASIEEIAKDPLSVKAYQYDLVINGYESLSGAVRNHEPEMMVELFKLAGYDKSVVENKFPALYNAFSYGAPPHAGSGAGFDRIMMLLTKNEFIRDVIAFPMNKNACDPLTNAPTTVDEKALKDVHIMLRPEVENN